MAVSSCNVTVNTSLYADGGRTWINCDHCTDQVLLTFRIVTGYLMSPVLALGVVGNTLAFLTFARGQFKAPTYIYFRCLAISDGLTTVLRIPYVVTYGWQYITFTYWETFYYAHINFLANTALLGTSSLLLADITVDRFMVIYKPLLFRAWSTRSRARNLSILCFIFPIIFFIPVIFTFKVCPGIKALNGGEFVFLHTIDHDYVDHFLYEAYRMLGGVFVTCNYLAIIVFTILAVIGYHKRKQDRTRIETEGRAAAAPAAPAEHIQDIRHLLKLMVSIAIMNMIFVAPSIIAAMPLSAYRDRHDIQTILNLLAVFAVSCNSSFNFYIYLIGHRHFRRQFITLLLHFCQRMNSRVETNIANG